MVVTVSTNSSQIERGTTENRSDLSRAARGTAISAFTVMFVAAERLSTSCDLLPPAAYATLKFVAEGVNEAADREVYLRTRGEDSGAPVIGDLMRVRGAITAILRAVLREQPRACTVIAERRRAREAGGISGVIVIAEEHIVQR